VFGGFVCTPSAHHYDARTQRDELADAHASLGKREHGQAVAFRAVGDDQVDIARARRFDLAFPR
jgi:hypothetical protein